MTEANQHLARTLDGASHHAPPVRLIQLNEALMKDSDYLGIAEKAKGLWVEGSLQDTIVNLAD